MVKPSPNGGDVIPEAEARKLEEWLRAKYEKKEYCLDASLPEPKVLVQKGEDPMAVYQEWIARNGHPLGGEHGAAPPGGAGGAPGAGEGATSGEEGPRRRATPKRSSSSA